MILDDVKSRRRRFAEGTSMFEAVLAEPQHRNIKAFVDYWRSKHSDGRLPRRDAIDPVEIPTLLPNILLIDILGKPAQNFRYRLIGTRIVEVDGVDFTGKLLTEMVPDHPDFSGLWRQHRNAAEGSIEVRCDTMKWLLDNSREHISYLITLLPLRRDSDEIEMLLGYIHHYLDTEPPALLTAP